MPPLARDDLGGPRGEGYRRMIDASAVGRASTPDQVGGVGALLMDRTAASRRPGGMASLCLPPEMKIRMQIHRVSILAKVTRRRRSESLELGDPLTSADGAKPSSIPG